MKKYVKLIIAIIIFIPILLCISVEETKKKMQDLYGENKEITGEYDQSLSVKCKNGIFVGKLKENVISFKGIPYAKPPIDELRWKNPIPVEDSNKVYQAYYYGKTPIQREKPISFGSYYPQGEDCLYLNIWVNKNDKSEDKPIIAFIHGGSYKELAANEPLQDGQNLVEKFHDLIFVSIEYRLGSLGFINFESVEGGENYKTTNNLGLLDMICGLKWIQNNIKNFGGDPAKVTLMGESAGAAAISLLPLIDKSNGLFKRIIAESGSLSLSYSKSETKLLAEKLLQKSGAKNMEDLIDLSEEEMSKLMKEINDYSNFAERDGNILPLDLYEAYKDGKGNDIDMLLGTNEYEFNYWVKELGFSSLANKITMGLSGLTGLTGELLFRIEIPILFESYYYKDMNTEDKKRVDQFLKILKGEKIWKYSEFFTEIIFRLPMTKQAEYHSEAGGNTYVYIWKYAAEQKRLGAFHTIEMPYTLNNVGKYEYGTIENSEFENKVQEMWVNFARTGNPSISKINWEQFDTDKRKIMVIDENFETIEDYKPEQRKLLEPLLKYNFSANKNTVTYNIPFVYKLSSSALVFLLILFLIIRQIIK